MTSLSERVAATFAAYGTPDERPFEEMLSLYGPNIHFVDPFHDFQGKAEFTRMMENLRASVRMRFDNVLVMGGDEHFFMSWKMGMRLKVGPEVPVLGITEFRSRDGVLVYQRDVWDTLSSFVDVIPGAGPMYRGIVQTLFG